jgi:hypothetical protein
VSAVGVVEELIELRVVELAAGTIELLHEIHQGEVSFMAAIVRRANSPFGENGPPRARSARQERLFELTANNDGLFDEYDVAFYEYPDDISALLVAYLS